MPPGTTTLRPLVSEVDLLVLAGGLGTRLGDLLADTPKLLAPIAGRPFLYYLLRWLAAQGAGRVVLALGHRAGSVVDYLATNHFPPLEIIPSIEPHPLGTAGAVAHALPVLRSDLVLVMNGDTYVDADLSAFVASHRHAGAAASVLCVPVDDPQRYGRVEIDPLDRIVRFEEKSLAASVPSWINAGVYLFDRTSLACIARLGRGSLERDFLEAMSPGAIHAFRTRGGFLDIGTPESLTRAAKVLPRWDT